jgi:type IV pilus assembly protein PilX
MKMQSEFSRSTYAAKQQGSVLLIGLVFLVILTLLGISNMKIGIMEERMASSFNDRNSLAFESAELALREGEKYLNGVAIGPFTDTVLGMHKVYPEGSTSAFWQVTPSSAGSPACSGSGAVASFNWLQDGATSRCSSVQLPVSRKLPGTAEAPRYVIEELADVPKPGSSVKTGGAKDSNKVYRITARGVGAQATTVVILQSTFKR